MKKQLFIIILYIISFGQTKQLEAIKIDSEIVIDGIEEDIWEKTHYQSDFHQEEPKPLEPATEKTAFKILYDSNNLYVFIKAYQKRSTVLGRTGKRETATYDGDNVLIFLDPNLDKTTGYVFGITPSNVQFDGTMFDDNRFYLRWDAIWDSETRISDNFWTVEIKIPLRILKFQKKTVQNWGLNIERYIKRKEEFSQWQAFRPETGTRISTIGRIMGLKNLESKNEINLIPSVLSVFDSKKDYNPFKKQLMDLNIRYNLDAENTFVAAIKPDFAQVETDQDRINYSDYPTRLIEKRPFFLEGNEIFETHESFYYSRRMVKPDFAAKFIGSSKHFKYGLSFVRNDGFSKNIKEGIQFVDKEHKEDFLFTRLKYRSNNLFEISYLGQYVKSDYELSGFLHSMDITYRPTEYFQFDALFAKTEIKDNQVYKNTSTGRKNHNLYFKAAYKSDLWNSSYKYVKKTRGFEQNLAGFLETNNFQQNKLILTRKIRFKDSWMRQIQLKNTLTNESTIDNNSNFFSYNFEQNYNMQFRDLGKIQIITGISTYNGYRRHYGQTTLANHKILYDNYGAFFAVSENAVAKYIRLITDRAKFISLNTIYVDDYYKQSNLNRIDLQLKFKARQNLEFSFYLNYIKLSGSQYISKNLFRTYGLKTEYALLNNLFFKSYIQHSNQSKTLSNNLVLTYEYQRGNFLYLAYNETGILWENNEFTKGSILKNYQLGRRTFSLKWTYSFYL